jgi:hypothetical protein
MLLYRQLRAYRHPVSTRSLLPRKDAISASDMSSDWRLRLRRDATTMMSDVMMSEIRREQEVKNRTISPPPINASSQFSFPLKSSRRRNAGWCGAYHSPNAVRMLKTEFGFRSVDPLKTEEWDLIYGGYPHCGDGNGADPPDWERKEKLNKHLNEKGWHKLKPWQVWFPCMGCRTTYCNKRELCRLVRDAMRNHTFHGKTSAACYLLPEHRAELEMRMHTDRSQLWVVKRDGPNLHLHAGKGVWYAHTPADLPAKALTEEPEYLVMPYVRPFLGSQKTAEYRRKSELRIYLAVTSVSPTVRLYAYSQAWIVLAGSKYRENASTLTDKCMHDTHAHSGRSGCDEGLSGDKRQLTFEEYASKVNMPVAMRNTLLPAARELLSSIIHRATPSWQQHNVNAGIAAAGASCFSYMRADLGISEDGHPVVFEINELPYVNEEASQIRPLQLASMRELFSMIGLAHEPILYGEAMRETFEMNHRGGWLRMAAPAGNL